MPHPLIRLIDVKKEYINGEVVTQAVSGVTTDILAGQFVSLMGPSGSGKSTLMHIMGFLDHPSSGTYFFQQKDVSRLSDDELAIMRRDEVGFVFQFFNLLANSTVLENVSLPLLYARIPKGERKKKAMKAIESVGLQHRVDHVSNQLSGGERQRVAIARAIVNEPQVIFADEPTGNLDSRSGEAVLEILAKLNDTGHTIIMVTHEKEAAEFAERILHMRDGRLLNDSTEHKPRRGSYYK